LEFAVLPDRRSIGAYRLSPFTFTSEGMTQVAVKLRVIVAILQTFAKLNYGFIYLPF
jgi:hypothetical protein